MSGSARVGLARVGVVLALLAAGVAAGQATLDAAPEPPAAEGIPVIGRTVVCPDVLHDGDRGATAVTAAGAVARSAKPLAGPGQQLPDDPVVRDLGRGVRGPFVVSATGEAAGALTVEQATRATGGSKRGLAALACPAPSTSSWFVGGATGVGFTSELMLVNLEEQPTLVDVSVWTADGAADPRPGRGLSVPAGGRLVVPLARLAPDRDLLALHVQTTRGRVASALRVVRADGRIPWGVEWVPQALPPAQESVVPGLPPVPGRRQVLVTNPAAEDAVVSVELTTEDGQYVPEGMAEVAVPAGTSVAVDVSSELAGTWAAARVRSDGPPVLAGALVVDDQRGRVRDVAYSTSTPVLSSTAVLADVRLSPPTEVTLVLSALVEDAVVDVVPVAGPGAVPAPQRVEVPAAASVTVALSRFLPPGSTGSLAFEVRPVRGQVHAARFSRERGARGPFTTLLPLTPVELVIGRPVVVADPGAGR